MLKEMGLKFEGQLHSGIDDTKNIAKLMNAMMNKGAQFCYPLAIRHRKHQVIEEEWPGAFRCPTEVPKDLMRPVDAAAAKKANDEDADASPSDDEEAPASPAASGAAAADESGDDGDGTPALKPGDDDGVVDVMDVPDRDAAAAGGIASGDDEDHDAGSGEADEESSDGEVSAAVAAVAAANGGSAAAKGPKKDRPSPKLIHKDLDRIRDISERIHKRKQVHSALATAEDLAVQRALAGSGKTSSSAAGVWGMLGLSGKSGESRTRFLMGLGLLSTINMLAAVWYVSADADAGADKDL
jgi:hypothetical protein